MIVPFLFIIHEINCTCLRMWKFHQSRRDLPSVRHLSTNYTLNKSEHTHKLFPFACSIMLLLCKFFFLLPPHSPPPPPPPPPPPQSCAWAICFKFKLLHQYDATHFVLSYYQSCISRTSSHLHKQKQKTTPSPTPTQKQQKTDLFSETWTKGFVPFCHFQCWLKCFKCTTMILVTDWTHTVGVNVLISQCEAQHSFRKFRLI